MKPLLLLLMGTMALAASAEAPGFIIKDKGGVETTLPSTGLRLNFTSDGQLVATSSTATMTWNVTQLSSMRFDGASLAIANPVVANGDMSVYDVNGTFIGVFKTLDAVREAITLPAVVIVKQDGVKSEKILLKK